MVDHNFEHLGIVLDAAYSNRYLGQVQFAMVEELALLVKDNLPCKHLVLSTEDLLLHFLQDETSLDKVIELEPMNAYNRLLLHRLADIFGFSHHSIGEGDDRHLILQRCEDTSIPSILVADMLWEHDDYQSPMTSQLLSRRENGSTVQIGPSIIEMDKSPPAIVSGTKVETISARVSLEDREAAYLAARKRIFSTEDDYKYDSVVKERPRNNPVVARRMIAHALGQRMKQSNDAKVANMGYAEPANEVKSEKGQNVGSSKQSRPKSIGQQSLTVNNGAKIYSNKKSVDLEGLSNVTIPSRKGCDTNAPKKHDLKDEHIGAAKRMFGNALRMHLAKDTVVSKCGQTKQADKC